jgi:hypothetical protein
MATLMATSTEAATETTNQLLFTLMKFNSLSISYHIISERLLLTAAINNTNASYNRNQQCSHHIRSVACPTNTCSIRTRFVIATFPLDN